MSGVYGAGRRRWWTGGLALILLASPVWAGSRGVDLRAELQSAQLVGEVEIVDYTPEGLRFRFHGSNPVEPLSARYSDDPTWVPRVAATLDFHQDILTAEWPPRGSSVLIVVDSDNIISLFAWEHGADYRFWSPWMTGSVAYFLCESPARPLEATRGRSTQDPTHSWDGCLMPAAELATLRSSTLPPTPSVTEDPGPPEATIHAQPQFGFRMEHETFQALRDLAPELDGAHWPGLTVDGQRAWDTSNLTAVYNTGAYLEDDLNGDGEADAALLLSVPQPDGTERQHLLVATRRIPGVPWTRIGLVALPASPREWSVMDAIEQSTTDPQLTAFFKTERRSPEPVVQASGVSPAPDAATRPIAEWVAQLTDADPRVRLEAAEALGRFGPDAEAAIEPLVQRFYDPEELVRNAAGDSLEQIGPASVPALRQLVLREGSTHGRHDPGARSQRLAVALLGRLTPVTEEAVALAADVCRDRAVHDLVRHDACLSLAALGAQEARVRQQTIETLLQVFQETDADPSLRTELIYAFGRLGPEPPVVTTLARALQEHELFVRRAAAGTLAQFGASARAALPALRTALSDADPEVKASVQRAIEQMAGGDALGSERRR